MHQIFVRKSPLNNSAHHYHHHASEYLPTESSSSHRKSNESPPIPTGARPKNLLLLNWEILFKRHKYNTNRLMEGPRFCYLWRQIPLQSLRNLIELVQNKQIDLNQTLCDVASLFVKTTKVPRQFSFFFPSKNPIP